MGLTIGNKLKETLAQYAEHPALFCRQDNQWQSISYKELGARISAAAVFLSSRGICSGDKVAVILPNGPTWPLIFFAVVSLGAVVVPVNPEANEWEMRTILRDAGVKLVFTEDSVFAAKNKSWEGCLVISIDADLFKEAIREARAPSHLTQVLEDSPACILYTSGTTDEPKGVVLTHANLMSNCAALAKLQLVGSKDSVLAILPLHHTFALTVTMLLPFFSGMRIIYPQTLRGDVLSQAMQETNPTLFVAVPKIFYLFHQKIKDSLQRMPFAFLLDMLLDILYLLREKTGINTARFLLRPLHQRFGASMRLFASGGAKLNETVEKDLFRWGFTILEGYGLTETSPVVTLNSYAKPKIGSAGLAIPGVEVKISNKNSQGIGEVIVRGPNVMRGYYRRDDFTASVIKDGWFYSGDLGYIDDEGYLFITGRLKEVIVLSTGVNIYPEELETIYLQDRLVKEMCIFEIASRTHLKDAAALWAAVVPDMERFNQSGKDDLRAALKACFDNVSRTLPAYKRIQGFSVTAECLPRTLLGKLKRFAVKEQYAPHPEANRGGLSRQQAENTQLSDSAAAQKVICYLQEHTRVKKHIMPGDLLELDLGVDSLARVELASGLERIFGVKINDEIINSAFTVKDIISGIDALLKQRPGQLPDAVDRDISRATAWHDRLEVLPKKKTLDKIDLTPGPASGLAWQLFSAALSLAFSGLFQFKVEGRENVPRHGPYIMYANHASYLDAFLIVAGLPNHSKKDLFFLGFRHYFNAPIIRNCLKAGRIIPLDFFAHFLEALRSSYYVLKNKKNICVFPEGSRSFSGEIDNFKKGFGILAKESKSVLVPVLIEGAFEAWPRSARFPKPHPITVRFGKPLTLDALRQQGEDDYEAICTAARDVLRKMKGV